MAIDGGVLDLTSCFEFLSSVIRFLVGAILGLQGGRLAYREGFTSPRPWLYLGVSLVVLQGV